MLILIDNFKKRGRVADHTAGNKPKSSNALAWIGVALLTALVEASRSDRCSITPKHEMIGRDAAPEMTRLGSFREAHFAQSTCMSIIIKNTEL
jgi:hypothetical protein